MGELSFPVRVPLVKVEQPLGEFYLTRLDARTLLRVTYSDPLRVLDVREDTYDIGGTQRQEKSARLSDLGRFIETSEATFPTPIILAANYARDEGVLADDDERRWRIEHIECNGRTITELVIPSHVKVASIVDGQHRLHGFQKTQNVEKLSMELPCAIFFDLANPYQGYIFAVVNFNQKKVDRSLAYELIGIDSEELPTSWTPEKTAVFLCRKLNADPDSPFHGHIKVAAKQEQEDKVLGTGDWTVSTATIVDGLLKLFSKRPPRDRDIMMKKLRTERRRTDLEDDGSPLRGLFRDTNDVMIYLIVRNFFEAASGKFWEGSSSASYIKKTVGVQALFDVLATIVGEMLKTKNLREETFAQRLEPARKIKFESNFFQASGKGRVRLRNAILGAMGEWDPNDADPSEQKEYREIIGEVPKAGTG